jgi:hypothetical protein
LQEKSVITRVVEVAGGVFAPGHLGELTRFVDFDLVDRVLAVHGAAGSRVRVLPGRVTVYFVLALALFEGCSYRAVWGKLTASLAGLVPGRVALSSLSRARARLGVGVFRALFEEVSGTVGAKTDPGVCWRGWRTVAIDGTSLQLPESGSVTVRYGKRRDTGRWTGYPLAYLVVLVETGTRAVIEAVFGPEDGAEKTMSLRLCARVVPGMLVLADSGLDTFALLSAVGERGAAFLVRASAVRGPRCERVLSDGSFLTTLRPGKRAGVKPGASMPARVIDAVVTVHLSDGTTRIQPWRLITSLLDPGAYPAADLVALYHERWQAETAYAQLKAMLLAGRVLRSCTAEGIEQEIWAILTLYQVLVRQIAEAGAAGSIDTDRLSFTIALETARDQTVLAAGIFPDPERTPLIITHLLASPYPAGQRQRLRARTLKSFSTYISHHGRTPDRCLGYELEITVEMFEHGLPARPRT